MNGSVPNFHIKNALDNSFDLKQYKEMTITPKQEKSLSNIVTIKS